MNMDYSFCEAIRHIDKDQGLVEIYDIVCQWWKNLQCRIQSSRFLQMPNFEDLVFAIGKFHLGGHIEECFPLFSLNFVHGAAQVDGEILETLWWPINKIAGITRAMSKAHRREILDDNMYDSNWKKWVGIGKCVSYIRSLAPLDFLLSKLQHWLRNTTMQSKGVPR